MLATAGNGFGLMSLAGLLAAEKPEGDGKTAIRPNPPAKHVIFLFMTGGPSHMDLFDPKPVMAKWHMKAFPGKIKYDNAAQASSKVLHSQWKFRPRGECGTEMSELVPHIAGVADDICLVRSMHTNINGHESSIWYMNTGRSQPGRPALGSWLTYGLGSENDSLPGFVVLQSGPRGPRAGNSLWASGFLPTSFQGVPFRGKGDPILHLRSPEGMTRTRERKFYDAVGALNRARLEETGDPEILTRLNAYEMAYRMQSSAPELMDLSKESPRTLDLYGVTAGQPSYASNCLLARRLVCLLYTSDAADE